MNNCPCSCLGPWIAVGTIDLQVIYIYGANAITTVHKANVRLAHNNYRTRVPSLHTSQVWSAKSSSNKFVRDTYYSLVKRPFANLALSITLTLF